MKLYIDNKLILEDPDEPIKMTIPLYGEIPDLSNSLLSTDYVTWLAGWLEFAAEHAEEMEMAIDQEAIS